MNHDILVQEIKSCIVTFLDHPPFMLTPSLAQFYETESKYINRAVNRNQKRFPADFCFKLTLPEMEQIRKNWCQSGTKIYAGREKLPYGFTREGANMLSSVLHTDVAIDRSLQIMRAFSALESQSSPKLEKLTSVEIFSEFKKYSEELRMLFKETQRISSQMLNISQELGKLNERMNVIETQMDAVMKVKGSFNENHWLFGKFAEAVAEGIDLNREEINKLKAQFERIPKFSEEIAVRKKRK